jgi:hypothetical protein
LDANQGFSWRVSLCKCDAARTGRNGTGNHGKGIGMTRGATAVASATTIEVLHALLKADLANETPFRYESVRTGHWEVARLVSALTVSAVAVPHQPGPARSVDAQAVQRFRAKIERFADAHNGSDAGHDREALVRHLIANARRLARGVRSEQVARELSAALAEAILLLASMTFDVAPGSELTQRYLNYARQLAHQAGDKSLEAAAFAAMSQQARYVGVAAEAAKLDAAAQQVIRADPT